MGEPRTAALRASPGAVEDTVALREFDVRQVLWVILGEERRALQVDGHEVEPIACRGMLGRSQRLRTRRADGGGRKSLARIGVPRGLASPIGIRGRDLLAVQRVIH